MKPLRTAVIGNCAHYLPMPFTEFIRGVFLKRNFLLMVFLVTAITQVAAEEVSTPLKDYRSSVHYGNLMCNLQFKIDQNLAAANSTEKSPSGDYISCIKEQVAVVKKNYALAERKITKQKAKAALKEHYIAGLNFIQGIDPKSGEIKIDYTRRQNTNEAKLDEMWQRFEVEQ